MDRCFLDLQPSSHWGRRNHLAWFPQPLLWPFGSEFCFRRASQIPTKITWWDGFQARTKTTKTSYEPNNDSYEKCGVQALPFLSFLCSTVFINMIQFYSIPGPYKIPRCLWPLCGGYGWKQTTVQQKAPIISSLWWFPMHPRSTLSPTLNRGPRCWQFAEEKYTLLNRLLQIP